MADTTPTYGFPYLELGDPPDLAAGTHDLATAVEGKFVTVDAAIAAINGLAPAVVRSTTDETGFTNTTFDAGLTSVGVAFTAPPSGAVLIIMSAMMTQNINTQATLCSFEVKTGATVGSGTLTNTTGGTGGDAAANSDRALTVGRAVNSGAVALLQADRSELYTGLTPGTSYNVRVMKCVDGGSGTVLYRALKVLPQL